MSAKPENTFIGSVHKHLPASVYRMKNHNPYNSGIADCWYSGKAGDLWAEYKFLVLPKRDDTVIDLINGHKPAISVLQQQWLKDRHAEGRRVAVIVGCVTGGVYFDGMAWECVYTTAAFRSWIETREQLAQRIRRHVEGS